MGKALLCLGLALMPACGPKRFGRIVTAIEASPEDPAVLVVTTCDLLYKKGDLEATSVGNCQRAGVRRSAAPSGSTTAPSAAEGRIVTAFYEHEGGGATITTCKLVFRDAKHELADCQDAVITTAPPGADR